MEPYTTGTGQELKVHERTKCRGTHCAIHNPSQHFMRQWPTHWRYDAGKMERLCPHGVGHPDPDSIAYGEDSVHGCDGCCSAEAVGDVSSG